MIRPKSKGEAIVRIPLVTVSTTNMREHWAKKARRAKDHRYQGWLWTRPIIDIGFPMTVTLTRIAPRKLDDDNLLASLKSVRDGVADRLGIDDRDPRVTWQYAQTKGDPYEQAVEIRAAILEALR